MPSHLRTALLAGLLAGYACSASGRPEPPLASASHRRDGDFVAAAGPREAGEAIRWETAVLNPGGAATSFQVKGLEVGASGFDGIVVVGEVYDLDRPEDFAGTYQRVLAPVASEKEDHGTLVGNEHGVLLLLRSADGDAMVGPGSDGIVIEPARSSAPGAVERAP